MALTFFLQFEGLGGSFEVRRYDLAGTRLGDLGPSGGEADFGRLIVELRNDAGLVEFLRLAATGQTTASVSLVGVDPTRGFQELHRINLADVAVASFEDAGSFGFSLTLDFSAIGIETTALAGDGAPLPPESFGYDDDADVLIPPPPDADPGETADTTGQATRFFLLVPDVDGGSQAAGFEHWFELPGFALGVNSAAGPGDPFSPLSFTIFSAAGLPDLLEKLATGKGFTGARLVGVNADDKMVYRLDLSEVQVQNLSTHGAGPSLRYDLQLEPRYLRVETFGQADDGSFSSVGVFAWDTQTSAQTFADPGLLLPDDGGALPTPSDYFLVVDGFSGPVAAAGFAGAFDLVGFQADDLTRGKGAVQGGDLPDLVVRIEGRTALADFLQAISTGQELPSVSLVGTIDAAGARAEVLRINLADVLVTGVRESDEGFTVSLAYADIGVRGRTFNEKGGLDVYGTPFGYDTLAERPAPVPADAVAGPAGLPVAVARYFVLIDGVDGGSTDPQHEGWFEAPAIGFDVAAVLQALAGGPELAQLNYRDLSVVLPGLSGLPDLLHHLATGAAIDGIRIEGVNAAGARTYSLELADVVVTGVRETAGESYAATFGYDRLRLQTFGQAQGGGIGLDGSFTWDVAKGTSAIDPIPFISPDTDGALTAGTRFFLEMTGLSGSSRLATFEGAFVVGSYDFDAVGGASGGDPTFSPLTVTFADDTGLAQFLSLLASGQATAAASLIGARANAEVFRLNLSDVVVTGVAEGPVGGYAVTLGYRDIGLVARALADDGSLRPSRQTFGYDLETLETQAPPPDAVPALPANGVVIERYFLLVDGVDGGSREPGHEGWFDLSHFDLTAAGASGPSGSPGFGLLSARLESHEGLTEILSRFAAGDLIRGARIEGVTQDGDRGYVLSVYDVRVRAVHESDQHDYALGLEYARISLTTYGQSGVGTPSPTGTFAWNRNSNSADLGALPKLAPGDGNVAPTASGAGFSTPEDAQLRGQLAAADGDGDPLQFSLMDGPAHGQVTIGADGAFSYTPSPNYNGGDSFTFRVFDGQALSQPVTVGLTVTPVNDAPAAGADTATASENQSVTLDVLANDTDPDAGDALTILGVGPVSGATVEIVGDQLVFTSGDAFDLLVAGQSQTASFTYTVRDGSGAVSTATVQVSVTGAANGATRTGGVGNDPLTGTALDERLDGAAGNDTLAGEGGADTLVGGAGADSLAGGPGIDNLSAGDGADTLQGGAGDDFLAGARGTDLFVFTGAFGRDVVGDFRRGEDDIRFEGVGLASFDDVIANAVQSGAHVVITVPSGDSVQLNNVLLSSLQSSDFLFA